MGFLDQPFTKIRQKYQNIKSAIRPRKDQSRKTRQSGDLREVVAVSLPILDLLAIQLQDVAKEVETKVVASCNSLMGIASSTNGLVQTAKSENDDESSEKALIDTTREVLGNLLDCIQESSTFSSFTTQRLQNIEQDLGSVISHLVSAIHVPDKSDYWYKWNLHV